MLTMLVQILGNKYVRRKRAASRRPSRARQMAACLRISDTGGPGHPRKKRDARQPGACSACPRVSTTSMLKRLREGACAF
jgi:hypothetical protein